MIAHGDDDGIDIFVVVQLPQVAVLLRALVVLGGFIQMLFVDVAQAPQCARPIVW